MQIFTVTISSVGSPNPIKIPASVNGERRLEMIPPQGHAWTEYDAAGKNSIAWAMDKPSEISRGHNQPPFVAGETVASANLDSGSGTLTCRLS
jgi:hypothetical protein